MSFTVMGAFPDDKIAEIVRKELHELFESIRAHNQSSSSGAGKPAITWPEIEVSMKYGIEWDETLLWIEEPLEQHIVRLNNYVFVSSGYAKRYYPDAIIALLKKKTEHVISTQYDHIILAEIRCISPESRTIFSIAEELNLYLMSKENEFLIPPWESFAPINTVFIERCRISSFDEIGLQTVQEFMRSLYNYQKARMQNRPLTQMRDEAIAMLQVLREKGYDIPGPYNDEFISAIIRSHGGMSSASAMGKKVAINDENNLLIPEIFFFNADVGAPAITFYLESAGCTDIELTFKSVPYSSRPDYL